MVPSSLLAKILLDALFGGRSASRVRRVIVQLATKHSLPRSSLWLLAWLWAGIHRSSVGNAGWDWPELAAAVPIEATTIELNRLSDGLA